jgi:hypothetical protein
MGTAFLYVDYSVPVEPLRQELTKIVSESPLWDGRVCGLQVTNLTERTMELRCQLFAWRSAIRARNRQDLRMSKEIRPLSNESSCLPCRPVDRPQKSPALWSSGFPARQPCKGPGQPG